MLRLMIDRPGRESYRAPTSDEERVAFGVTLDDCAVVSRAVGPALEVEDVIPSAYTLEVSSPGINRPLVRPRHFALAAGMQVRVKTRIPVEGESFFIAQLKSASEDHIVLDVRGEEVEVPYRLVAQANLEMDL
jgi:ribosome maturation factor RimP